MSQVQVELRSGVLHIVFDRPEKKNALTLAMYETANEAFERVLANPQWVNYINANPAQRANNPMQYGAMSASSNQYLSDNNITPETLAAYIREKQRYNDAELLKGGK